MISVYCLGNKQIRRIVRLYCYFRLESTFHHVVVPSRATKYIGKSGDPLFPQSNPILYHIIRFSTKIYLAGRLKCYLDPVDIRQRYFLIYFLHLKVKSRTQDSHEPRTVYARKNNFFELFWFSGNINIIFIGIYSPLKKNVTCVF